MVGQDLILKYILVYEEASQTYYCRDKEGSISIFRRTERILDEDQNVKHDPQVENVISVHAHFLES